MKNIITSEQINMLLQHCDYYRAERIINNLLGTPKTITIKEKEGADLLLFKNNYTPYTENSNYCCDTVHLPEMCISAAPGFVYNIEIIQCKLSELDSFLEKNNLNLCLYDLGLELRTYNNWYGKIIIVPFHDSENNKKFWVLKNETRTFSGKHTVPIIKLCDLESIQYEFKYNNDYIYFVVCSNKPEINQREETYAKQIRKTFEELPNSLKEFYQGKLDLLAFFKFIKAQDNKIDLLNDLINDNKERKSYNSLLKILIDILYQAFTNLFQLTDH